MSSFTTPAIVHDYMYDFAIKTKKEADQIFYEAINEKLDKSI